MTERPQELSGATYRIQTGHGYLYVTINSLPDSDTPFEIFATLGKPSACVGALMEAISRLASAALRAGADVQEIIKQVSGISCGHLNWDEGYPVMSTPDGLATALRKATGSFVPRVRHGEDQ